MHHNVFLSSEKYERIVLFIDLDFFRDNRYLREDAPKIAHGALLEFLYELNQMYKSEFGHGPRS